MTMTANNQIRLLMAEDIPPLIEVINATGLFPGDMLADMVAPHIAGDNVDHHWWTYDDGAPAAVAYAIPERMTDGTWNLLLIAVDPLRQGKGIGRALMARVESDLLAIGARLILVETSGLPEFDRTRRFYDAQGYVREARIRNYYQAGEDKIVFARMLR